MVLFQSFSGISRSSLRIRYSELFIRSSIDWRPARSAVTLYTGPTSIAITRKQTNSNRKNWTKSFLIVAPMPGVRGEQITFIAHGLNAERLQRVVVQLAAQAGDRHVDAAVHTVIAHAAQVLQQRLAIHDLPGVGRQFPQQIEIRGGQSDGFFAQRDLPVDRIDAQQPEMQRVVLGERLSRLFFRLLAVLAQVQTQARQQHRRRRGFQDIVVGAHFQRQDMVHVAVERGEQHDRAGEGGAQIAAQRHTVFAGQHDVQQHQIGLLALDARLRAVAARLDQHLDVVFAQIGGDQFADFRIVFHKTILCICPCFNKKSGFQHSAACEDAPCGSLRQRSGRPPSTPWVRPVT